MFDFDQVTLLHVDQRGTTAVAAYLQEFLYVEDSYLEDPSWPLPINLCFVSDNDGQSWEDVDADHISGAAGIAYLSDSEYPDMESRFPGPLVQASSVTVGRLDLAEVIGRVEGSVAKVVVVHDGERLEAVLTDGYFTAFWPSDSGSADITLEMLDATGAVLSTNTVAVVDINDRTAPTSANE